MADISIPDVVMAIAAFISLPISAWAIIESKKAVKSDRVNALLSLRQHYFDRFNTLNALANVSQVESQIDAARKDGVDALSKLKEIDMALERLGKDLLDKN